VKHYNVEHQEPEAEEQVFSDMVPDFIAAAAARTLKVGILGLGYVGLPLAEAFVKVGFPVIGFDVNQRKIDSLRDGKSYIRHIDDDRIVAMSDTDRFMVTLDAGLLGDADALIICVPTPINAHREPDLDYVVKTTQQIAKILRRGQLVVLESTTYPGTTEEIIKPILEATGLKAGIDFGLAYSPEREDPGNLDYSTNTIPKVVGADTDGERLAALALYGASPRPCQSAICAPPRP